ncbi:MAG TPA: hypothetical protein PKE03_12580, partial [Bacteroidales bacterium]|nr:hypothetical protein [Bacteroidales bacterium]
CGGYQEKVEKKNFCAFAGPKAPKACPPPVEPCANDAPAHPARWRFKYLLMSTLNHNALLTSPMTIRQSRLTDC